MLIFNTWSFVIVQLLMTKKYKSVMEELGAPELFKRGKISIFKWKKYILFDNVKIPKTKELNIRRNIYRATTVFVAIIVIVIILKYI